MNTYITVVGNHYTENTPIQGEYVYLAADPTNPVDKNAIRIINLKHKTLGYIPKLETVEYKKYIGKIGQIFKFKNGYRVKM